MIDRNDFDRVAGQRDHARREVERLTAQLQGAVSTQVALEDALLRHFTGKVPEPGDDSLIMAAQNRARARLWGQ